MAESVEVRVPPSGPAELSYAGLPLDAIEDLLPALRHTAKLHRFSILQPISLNTRPLTPLHQGHIGLFRRPDS